MLVLLSIIILLCDRSLIIESTPKLGHILFDPLSNEAKLSGKDIKNMMSNLVNNSFHDTSTEEHKDLLIPSKLNLRESENKESTKSPSYGYDFNDTICKTVGDRFTCGYDKNIGNIDNNTVDLGNGCRIRGDRLECGYLTGPFNNTRRPPANDLDNEQEIKKNNSRKRSDHTSEDLKNSITARSNPHTSTPGFNIRTTMTKKNNTINSAIKQQTNKNKVIKAATSSIVTLSKNITTSSRTTPGLTSSPSTVTSSYIKKISVTAAVTKKKKRYCVEKNDSIFCYNIKS